MFQGSYFAEDEGIDHIRIGQNSKSRLGRYLANSTRSPFRLAPFGTFESMEGFWYYVSSGCTTPALMKAYGPIASLLGHATRRTMSASFRKIIIAGLRAKIQQTPALLDMLQENELPFALYDLDEAKNPIYHHDWFVEGLNDIIKEAPWTNRKTPEAVTSELSGLKRKRWTETAEN